MNVKNLLGLGIQPIERTTTQSLRPVDRAIKSEEAHDRDANGQQVYEKNEKKKKAKMTHEQFLRALTILNEKAFMIEMSWVAFEYSEADFYYAEVKDAKGDTIRKISEFDLWELFEDVRPGEEKKGHLLKKTA